MKVYLLSRRIEHSLLVVCSLVFYFKYLDSVTWASVCPSATNNEPVLPGWKAGVSTGTSCFNKGQRKTYCWGSHPHGLTVKRELEGLGGTRKWNPRREQNHQIY